MKKRTIKRGTVCSIMSLMLAFIMVFSAPVTTMAASSYVKSLKLSSGSVSVKAGKSASVKATVKVSGKASKAVIAKSSNTSVAAVSAGKADSKGVSTIKITGKKAGKATITITTSGKNKKKKAMTKKITVKVSSNSSSNAGPYSLNYKSYKLVPGEELQLEVQKNGSKATDISSVYWNCSDYKVCNVSSFDGKVIAKNYGEATVTVTIDNKYTLTCKISVVDPSTATSDFDYDRDVTVTTGTKDVYIEFEINKDSVSEEELKEMGYNVEGGTASANVTCETATYTFKKLPETLGDIKKFDLTTKFGPMAASICALTTWKDMSIQNDGMYKNPIWNYFEYLNGPKSEISNAEKSGRYPSMQQTLNKGKYCYFEGASNTNNYTPTKPYTFTMYHGPYFIPAKSSTIAHPEGEPERHMILISFGGDDAERYIDVYQSSDGNWYSYEDQWAHLIAGIKDTGAAW